MRFVVIGTSGSGKTTFARALAARADCPHVELDALYWGPQWQVRPEDVFVDAVERATAGERWVADGNYSLVREALWSRATHLLWLNYGLPTVMSRVLRRTVGRIVLRRPLWHGNRESLRRTLFSRESILLWVLRSWPKNRRRFALMREQRRFAQLQWHEFRRPQEAAAYLRDFDPAASAAPAQAPRP